MSVVNLVDDLVTECREQLDEDNTTDVTDTRILQSLNRAQKKLVRIASRKYKPMFNREITLSTDDLTNTRELEIPDGVFGYIVTSVHVIEGSVAYEVMPAGLRKASSLESSLTTDIPSYYAIRGNKLLLYPTPKAGVSIRVRYQIRPPKLIKSQGRISNIDDLGSNILYVDALGSDLSTSVTDLTAFVNVIDSMTGIIRGTYQVSAIDTDNKKLTFKSASLDRDIVFGQTTSSSLSTDIELDDVICIANGSCVPQLVSDYDDFLVQYAVLEVRRSLGEATDAEYGAMKELEKDIELMWSGRPHKMKVARRNRHYGVNPTSLLRAYE